MRPTGRLHLGHLLGTLRTWRDAAGERTSASSSSPTGTRSRPTTTAPRVSRTNVVEMVIDWLASGIDPDARHDLRPVVGPGARRAAPPALDDHAARLARARPDLQGDPAAARRPRPLDLRLPRLSRAAGRRHPDVPRDRGAGRRRSGAARRADARDRAPLQPRLRRDLSRAAGVARRRAARARGSTAAR